MPDRRRACMMLRSREAKESVVGQLGGQRTLEPVPRGRPVDDFTAEAS